MFIAKVDTSNLQFQMSASDLNFDVLGYGNKDGNVYLLLLRCFILNFFTRLLFIWSMITARLLDRLDK